MPAATSNTVFGIINDAMHDAGYLSEGDNPNSEQLASCQRRLCDIINLWQTQGLKLFLLQGVTIPLVAGQNRYTLAPTGNVVMARPLQVMEGYILDANSNIKRPINPLAWSDWMTLSQTTGNDGTISSFFVDKKAAYMDVVFWNTPNTQEAANVAVLLMRQQAPNPYNLEEHVSFPQEWRIALRWGLADDIATGQPQAIMDRCAERATVFREALEDWDVEDTSTRFTPDTRMFGNPGSFNQ